MGFSIVQGDITVMDVTAIVNAANSGLRAGGGVCGAIFAAAGRAQLQQACEAFGSCETGDAVITPGFGLKARYVVHAVGPVWRGGSHGEAAALKSCYERSLALAVEHGCTSIAFPLISSGIYGYPKEEAISVAVESICGFLQCHEMEVFLVLFDHTTMVLAQEILNS